MIFVTCQAIFRGDFPEFIKGHSNPLWSLTKTHHATRENLLKAIEEHCQICTVLWRALLDVRFRSSCVFRRSIAIFYLGPRRGLLYLSFARSPELISIALFGPSATRLIFHSAPTRHRGQHFIDCLLESSSEMDIDLFESSSEMYAPCQCGPPRLPANSAARFTAFFE